jgi:hypothetical protein
LPDSLDAGVGPQANLGTLTGLHWRTVLEQCVVSNIFDLPEVNRYCAPFDPRNDVEPGIVIRFSTTVQEGKNYFGWVLAGGDSAYDSSHFATKIRSLGVWFANYDIVNLAAEPRVYLFPYGVDTLRSPGGDGSLTRSWTVIDQILPVPFPVTSQDIAQENWIPMNDNFNEPLGGIRRFSRVRAYNDSGEYTPDEALYSHRLIGRSVWNSDWMLVIPGSTLHGDPNQGLQKFLDGVSDILIFFETYSYPGN